MELKTAQPTFRVVFLNQIADLLTSNHPSIINYLEMYLPLSGLYFITIYHFKMYITKFCLFFQYLDFDNLPDTNFSCVGKVIGGYYADLETNCQMFHVCTIGQLDEPMDIRFLCLNGTVFDQVRYLLSNILYNILYDIQKVIFMS